MKGQPVRLTLEIDGTQIHADERRFIFLFLICENLR